MAMRLFLFLGSFVGCAKWISFSGGRDIGEGGRGEDRVLANIRRIRKTDYESL
jgi:hypothetical protein